MINPALQGPVQLALQDAARRTGLDAAALKVTLAESVTWSDGSAGCPQPDRMYTQALVSGFRILIRAGSETLAYHGSRSGQPFFCPADRAKVPVPDSRI